jgi:predicted CXXCH cytochrome family protein
MLPVRRSYNQKFLAGNTFGRIRDNSKKNASVVRSSKKHSHDLCSSRFLIGEADMKKWLFRCLISLALAGPMMLLSVALANADQVGLRTERVSCLACHPEFQSVWEMGQHARTGSNASFIEAWEAQGKPGDCMTCHATGYDEAEETWVADGVVCAACHPGSSDKHIDDAANNPMPIDRSAKFCGQCHSDTYFDWQASGHYGNGLDCVNCHDPHGTELKTGDPSTLCDNCHVQMASRCTLP